MRKFRLTIHQDEDAGHLDPFDEDSPLFKLHSFNDRDTHFTHPDQMECARCSWDFIDHPEESIEGEDVDEDVDICDNFTYPEGYWLSHYEHGQRHWSIQGTVHYPDMQWDGVRTAGYLEVTVPKDEREWWDGRPEEDKLQAAKNTIANYTSWINGEVYGYTLKTVETKTCDLGFVHENEGADLEDSCFGFIGWDWFQLEVQMATDSEGATAENTEVVDKAHGMADYGDFFKTAEVSV